MTAFFFSSRRSIGSDFLPRQLRLEETQRLLVFSSLPGDPSYLEKMYTNPALELEFIEEWPYFLQSAFLTNSGYPGGLDLFQFLLHRGYGSRKRKVETLAMASIEVCDLTRKRPYYNWGRPLPKGSLQKLELFLEYLLQSRDVWSRLDEYTKGLLGRLIVLFASADTLKAWIFSVSRQEFFPDSIMRPFWTEAPTLFRNDLDRLHTVVIHMFKNANSREIDGIVRMWIDQPGTQKTALDLLDKYYQLNRFLSKETLIILEAISKNDRKRQ
jgi:hypothetical protein